MNRNMKYLMESSQEAERLEAKTSVQAVRDELRLLALRKGGSAREFGEVGNWRAFREEVLDLEGAQR